jgi:hypothetical protein
LGTRSQDGRLDSVEVRLLLILLDIIPTSRTARRHFFWRNGKFSGSFDEKLVLPKVN